MIKILIFLGGLVVARLVHSRISRSRGIEIQPQPIPEPPTPIRPRIEPPTPPQPPEIQPQPPAPPQPPREAPKPPETPQPIPPPPRVIIFQRHQTQPQTQRPQRSIVQAVPRHADVITRIKERLSKVVKI